MHRLLPAIAVLLLIASCTAEAQEAPPADAQIEAAVLAAPPALRDSATVLGYRDGQLATLREGSGPLICLADDPADDRFHVACYHRSLAPFMKIGRVLRAKGLERAAVDSVRRAKIAAGTLSMPDHPAALYSLTGPAGSFDPATGTAEGAEPLHVVYVPHATAEATGLPTSGGTGEPWIMEGGSPWAHIMITPPEE